MRTQSRDTHPEAERVLIELIRKAPISKRFKLVRSATRSLLQTNLHNIQKQHPDATQAEIAQIFVSHTRHQEWCALCALIPDLMDEIEIRPHWAFREPDILVILHSLADILAKHALPFYIGGSIASSVYGMQQLARDIDLVVDLQPAQVHSLVTDLQSSYVVDEHIIDRAIQHHMSFSMIHLETLLRIDIFLPRSDPYEQQVSSRRQWHVLDNGDRTFPVSSPEDIILVKLQHHKQAGIVSDDQWNDILGVLKVQGPDLDLTYLERWSTNLGTANLLKQLYTDAGL